MAAPVNSVSYGCRGRPEKQTNPKAKNLFVPKPVADQKKQIMTGARAAAQAPPSLPSPKHVKDASHVKTTEEPLKDNTLFITNMEIREDNPYTKFTASYACLPTIVNDMYQQYTADNKTIGRNLLPEYLQYYATAMLWLRIIELKRSTLQPLNQTELNVLAQTDGRAFTMPAPIAHLLKFIGHIETMTQRHLTPSFPPLPTKVINQVGGFYPSITEAAPIDVDNHNLYEEIPCLGVMADAICNALSAAEQGPYNSRLTTGDFRANANLPGFRNLSYRRPEAKSIAFEAEITSQSFSESIADTAINYDFISSISNIWY